MKHIAVYGGTFDPPTLAHEAITTACLKRNDMDEVWLMPSGRREDKPGMTPDGVRLAMLFVMMQTSFKAATNLYLSTFELQMDQPTETYKTVAALEQAYQATRFWFVFGADSYHNMMRWSHGTYLHKTLGMLLVPRVGYQLPPEEGNIRYLHVPGLNEQVVSSTQVRSRLKESRDVAGMVSVGLMNYLSTNNPYRRGTMAG